MPRLPMTLKEVEALEFARATFAEWRSRGNPWSDDCVFTSEASRAFLRHFLRRAALEHPIHMMHVIAWARTNDPDVKDVLATLIIEFKSRGESLPTELAAYDMEMWRDSLSNSPRKLPARKKKNNLLRDIFIAMLIADVCTRFGLNPTRRSQHRESGCSIVAMALVEVNMQLGEAAIVAIWQKYGHAVAPL